MGIYTDVSARAFEAAKMVGVDPQDFNLQLHGGRKTTNQVLDHFGLETRMDYVKKGRCPFKTGPVRGW